MRQGIFDCTAEEACWTPGHQRPQGLKVLAKQANLARTWRFGVFEVDTGREELRRSGAPVKMREQSFRILVCLLEHPGEIVTRGEPRQVLWPSDTFVDFDHSLNTAVMKLREALGDSTGAPFISRSFPSSAIDSSLQSHRQRMLWTEWLPSPSARGRLRETQRRKPYRPFQSRLPVLFWVAPVGA